MTNTPRTLLEELETIDAALLDGTATEAQEARGQQIVTLADAAPNLLAALRFALPYMEDLAASSDNPGEHRAALLMRDAISQAEGYETGS